MVLGLSPASLQRFQAIGNEAERQDAAAVIIIDYLLGADWRSKNVLPKAGDKGFFRFNTNQTNIPDVRSRMAILAENLYNLSNANIPGWKEFLQVCRSDMTEGRFTEINAAVHLYRMKVPFAFHIPGKYNYDFDVTLRSGAVLPTEAKARVTGNDFDAEKTIQKLKKGGNQLPDDRPGAMFFEFPNSWTQLSMKSFQDALTVFLRQYRRVVSLTIYTQIPKELEGARLVSAGHCEIISRFHRFDRNAEWSIFGSRARGKLAVADTPWQTLQYMVKWYMEGQPKSGIANA